jgi:predicted metal-dependent phosphoesterase TrpH
MHVHTRHSGMCNVPLLSRVCRESYNDPMELYRVLKARGMELVTVTDHDSIDAAESLRQFPDFFLSEEVTCRTPAGTEIHVGVFDINETQHIELQRRRDNLASLFAYLGEQRLLFCANHIFSALTGARRAEDFALFVKEFPAFETRNGQMAARSNDPAKMLALRHGKIGLGGSDAHTLAAAGKTYTEVRASRTKEEFFEALKRRQCKAGGEHGGWLKLTSAAMDIAFSFLSEKPVMLPLLPLAAAVPAVTFTNGLLEAAFAAKWAEWTGCRRGSNARSLALRRRAATEVAS